MMTVEQERDAQVNLWSGIVMILRSIRLLAGSPNTLNFKTISIEIEVKFRG